ncbi:MAG: agmatine deiminase family protein, partial [Armatimonadetes bacterium]|nr:agmatine deiminase family protein [Armatimonadota bacterium]
IPALNLDDLLGVLTRGVSEFKAGARSLLGVPTSTTQMADLMMPTSTGKIKKLLMTTNGRGADASYLNVLRTLAENMPDTQFTILATGKSTRERIEGVLAEMKDDGRIQDISRFKVVDAGSNFSIWAQDSILVQGNTFIAPDRMWYPGYGDRDVAQLAADANPGFQAIEFHGMYVDGGNEIASPEYLFVGSDALKFAASQMSSFPMQEYVINGMHLVGIPGETKEDLARRIIETRFPSQKLVIIGSENPNGAMEQPGFHIDMAVSMLGNDLKTRRPVAVVGDPSMAKRLIIQAKERDPQGYQRAVDEIKSKLSSPAEDPLQDLQDAADERYQERFDDVAKTLKEEGFIVDRIPHLGTERLAHRAPWITYNNMLLDEDRIFMPVFGLPALDNAAKAVYEKRGYNVVPVDMVTISSLEGAINCITKVLEREIAA